MLVFHRELLRGSGDELPPPPKTGFLGPGFSKNKGWLGQELTEIEDGGTPKLVATVTGGLNGAQCEQSSLKLMSPKGRVWLGVNALTLPMPWGVATWVPYSGRAAVLSWAWLCLGFPGCLLAVNWWAERHAFPAWTWLSEIEVREMSLICLENFSFSR